MKIKLSDYVASFLADNGITDVFTVTGGGAMHLNDSLGHEPRLHCTYNHHEQGCAVAAEGYARLTRRIAAVCVTSGPGGTNAITGVMGGWLDSIPMLVLSGQVKFSTTIKSTDLPLRQLGDQEFNITDCVKCMTKYAVMVIEPNTIRYHLERALYLATHGRRGPAWLDIPLNVQGATIDTDDLIAYDPAEDAASVTAPRATKKQAKAVVERIRKAKRPVILAGEGIRIGGAAEKFLEVIERLGVPVVTAWNAHDLLWDDHPLYCGRPGTVGTRGGNFVLQNSDLMISLACRMNIRQISYNWENFAHGAYKIAVDIDDAELHKPTLSLDMPIQADIDQFFDVLLEVLAEGAECGTHYEWLAWCRETDARFPAAAPEFYEKKSPVNPYVFMREMSLRLGEGDVTVASNGSACVCSFQAMRVQRGQRLFTNSGCASMGYGLPAAVGAAVALKGKRVVCLEGDGSIQMNLQELQTAAHNKLNLKIFWLNNNGYHSIRQTQTNLFHANFCGVSAESGVSFPEAERIAYAYRMPFFRIDSADDIAKTVDSFFAAEGPAICEVVLDPAQFFTPKLSSRILPDGSAVSPSLEDMFPFLSEEEKPKIPEFCL